MTRPLHGTALAMLLLAAPATAQDAPGPRILDTSTPFAAGAEEVPIDTPSALVWSTYQSGQRDGWFYRLFPDGRGVISRDARFRREWTAVDCAHPSGCTADNAAAEPILADLEAWLARGGTPQIAASPLPAVPTSAAAAPAVPASDPVPARSAPPGRLPTALPETSPPRLQVVRTATPTRAPVLADTLPPRLTPPPAPTRAAAHAAGRQTHAPLRIAPQPAVAVRAAPPPAAPAPDARTKHFVCTLSGTLGLRYTVDTGSDPQIGKLSGTFGCTYSHPSGLVVRLALTGVPLAGQRSQNDSSLTYALSYPLGNGFTLQYASYSSEFPRQPQGVISAFGRGGFRLSKALPPVDLGARTGWAALGRLNCSAQGLWDPGEAPSASLSCGLTAFRKLTLRASAIAYSPGAQKAWQPDYTYSASYAVNDRVSVEYSNYSGNRWPWKGGGNSNGILGGSLRVTYRFSF